MNERVCTSIKFYEKCSVRFASAIRLLGKHCFLPSFANVFKCSDIPWLRDEKINV